MMRQLLFCLCCCFSSLAWAVNILPPSVEPERQTARPMMTQPAGEPAAIIGATPSKPSVDATSTSVYFNFAGFAIQGNTIFSDAELLALYQDKINTSVTLADLYALTEKMEALYTNKGYILTRMVIPAQAIDPDEEIKLLVVEGFVDNIEIKTENPALKDFLANMALPIMASKPLQLFVLEKTLLLMNDLPGIKVKGVLSASETTPGASHLTIDVTQRTLAVQAHVDNRGTIYTGPVEYLNYLILNNPGGYISESILEVTTVDPTHELFAASLTHNKPLGSEGTFFEALINYSEVKPGDSLEILEVEGYSHSFQMTLHQPILRQRLQNLSLWMGYDVLQSKTNALDDLLYLDRIESLRAGMLFDITDNWQGTTYFTAQASHGVNLFTGENQPHELRSRYYGSKDYNKTNASISRIQYLPLGMAAVVSAQGQFAFNQLLAAEEFGVGGQDYGLAYDYYEISGDSGYAGRLELHKDFFPHSTLLTHWQPYISYDGGEIWQIENDLQQNLTSLGGGVRFNFMKIFTGQLEVAKPLTKKVASENNSDARAFFYFTATL